MLSEQLKPCPFCGAELVRLQDKEPPGVARWDHPLPEVLSYEMCMLAGHTVWVRGPNDAARWNARSSPPADLKAVVEVLEPFARVAGPIKGEAGRSTYLDLIIKDGGTEELAVTAIFSTGGLGAVLWADDFRRAAKLHATLTASDPT